MHSRLDDCEVVPVGPPSGGVYCLNVWAQQSRWKNLAAPCSRVSGKQSQVAAMQTSTGLFWVVQGERGACHLVAQWSSPFACRASIEFKFDCSGLVSIRVARNLIGTLMRHCVRTPSSAVSCASLMVGSILSRATAHPGLPHSCRVDAGGRAFRVRLDGYRHGVLRSHGRCCVPVVDLSHRL